jgi:hypothetical protein
MEKYEKRDLKPLKSDSRSREKDIAERFVELKQEHIEHIEWGRLGHAIGKGCQNVGR